MGIQGRDGAFADLVAVPERNLHEVPDSVNDEQAVFVEPLAAAFQIIRQFPIESRMKVAVVGSGRLGLLVAQGAQNDRLFAGSLWPEPHDAGILRDKKGIQATPAGEIVARADRDVVVECTWHRKVSTWPHGWSGRAACWCSRAPTRAMPG